MIILTSKWLHSVVFFVEPIFLNNIIREKYRVAIKDLIYTIRDALILIIIIFSFHTCF